MRPFLSIVLPCYEVERYLPECLDSILSQDAPGIELIGVDDCSPDRSGEILAVRAHRDARVSVVTLPENSGLGPARNAGLDAARGEYVMFVDSDDTLVRGALPAIVERLRAVRPDVLFFDYVRRFDDGRQIRNTKQHLFREPSPPETFTLAERPAVMNLMMVAWNRAFRREFLVDLGVRFRPGFYEDIPVTYPALMAAERIGMLDRVCYAYRQRGDEGITRRPSGRHFEVFDQYEAVFAFMDEHRAATDRFRGEMYRRMLHHYFVILGRPDRVMPGDRKRFFLRMARDARRYRPPGYRHPAGKEGVRHRLAERGWYRPYATAHAIQAARIRRDRLPVRGSPDREA
ncbi:MAG TPA: glycosyltransferase family 2 protein [Actinomycetota bacterium]